MSDLRPQTRATAGRAGASAGPNMRRAVETLLSKKRGRPVRVAALRWEPSPFATLFPAAVISLTLDDGTSMSLFVKYLGPEEEDHPEKDERDREILIYEKLFAGHAELPVPSYFGSRSNRATRRHEVFLENVDGWNLKYQGLEHWFTAARRLADLQRHFADRREELEASEFLLRFDGDYFHEWADRALSTVAAGFADLAGDLRPIINGYADVSDLLAAQPVTLVHNDPSPKNVVADTTEGPARIVFVDWEMAGIGCGLLDLVHLKFGLDPESDARMLTEYLDELAGSDLVPEQQDFDCVVAACELHKTLYRLAWSGTWNLPLERVALWVDEARTFLERVRGREPLR